VKFHFFEVVRVKYAVRRIRMEKKRPNYIVRIPKEVVEAAGIKEGDYVVIQAGEKCITLKKLEI